MSEIYCDATEDIVCPYCGYKRFKLIYESLGGRR